MCTVIYESVKGDMIDVIFDNVALGSIPEVFGCCIGIRTNHLPSYDSQRGSIKTLISDVNQLLTSVP